MVTKAIIDTVLKKKEKKMYEMNMDRSCCRWACYQLSYHRHDTSCSCSNKAYQLIMKKITKQNCVLQRNCYVLTPNTLARKSRKDPLSWWKTGAKSEVSIDEVTLWVHSQNPSSILNTFLTIPMCALYRMKANGQCLWIVHVMQSCTATITHTYL
jgi:hypothetical protein